MARGTVFPVVDADKECRVSSCPIKSIEGYTGAVCTGTFRARVSIPPLVVDSPAAYSRLTSALVSACQETMIDGLLPAVTGTVTGEGIEIGDDNASSFPSSILRFGVETAPSAIELPTNISALSKTTLGGISPSVCAT